MDTTASLNIKHLNTNSVLGLENAKNIQSE